MFGATLVTAIVPNVTTGHVSDHIKLHRAWNAEQYANTINVMHADYGAVDGGSAAVNTTALNDARAEIVATGKPGCIVIPAGVDLPVTPDGVIGGSSIVYAGGGTLSTDATTVGALITFPAGSSHCGVDGLRFVSPDNAIVGVASITNDHMTVTRCKAFGARLWVGNDTTVAYADNDDTNITTNATITDNVCVATTVTDTSAAIWAFYARGGRISGNTVIGHAQGIVGWGGDANPDNDGALANARKAGGMVVTENVVTDCAGGGIWFSMCEGMTVTTNEVTGCGDVGIDFEGCTGCTASGGNYSANNTGGNFTTFFFCRGVRFTGNIGYLDGSGAQVMVRTQNLQSIPSNRDITYDGNTFYATGVIGIVSLEVAQRHTFTNNVLTNCRLDSQFNNQLITTITDNRFLFTEVAGAAFNAINVGQNHGGGRANIAGNEIITLVTQPAGSFALRVAQDDPTTDVVNRIDDNEFIGWGTAPAKVIWSGANVGFTAHTMIRRNNLGTSPAAVTIDNTGAATPQVVVSSGNYYDDTTAAP